MLTKILARKRILHLLGAYYGLTTEGKKAYVGELVHHLKCCEYYGFVTSKELAQMQHMCMCTLVEPAIEVVLKPNKFLKKKKQTRAVCHPCEQKGHFPSAQTARVTTTDDIRRKKKERHEVEKYLTNDELYVYMAGASTNSQQVWAPAEGIDQAVRDSARKKVNIIREDLERRGQGYPTMVLGTLWSMADAGEFGDDKPLVEQMLRIYEDKLQAKRKERTSCPKGRVVAGMAARGKKGGARSGGRNSDEPQRGKDDSERREAPEKERCYICKKDYEFGRTGKECNINVCFECVRRHDCFNKGPQVEARVVAAGHKIANDGQAERDMRGVMADARASLSASTTSASLWMAAGNTTVLFNSWTSRAPTCRRR